MDSNVIIECKLRIVGWAVHFWLLKDLDVGWLEALTTLVVPLSETHLDAVKGLI